MASVNNDIERYLKGELSPAEMHALEQRALHDPFLAEALEGAEHAGADDFIQDISFLRKSINEKTRKPKGLAKTITLNGFAMYAGIAAGLLLLFVSTYVIFISIPKRNSLENHAMQKEIPSVVDSISQESESTDSLLALNKITESPTGSRNESRRAPSSQQKRSSTPSTVNDVAEKSVDREEQEAESQEYAVGDEETKPTDKDLGPSQPAIQPLPEAEVNDLVRGPVASTIPAKEEAKKKAAQAAPQFQSSLEPKVVRGRVTDGSEPIPGANVIIKGTAIGTVTDINGDFQIPVQDENSILVINFIGYSSKEVAAKTNEVLQLQLSPDVLALSEVVVVGYGESTNSEPVFTMAEPVGGFSDFKKYLNEQLKYPQQALENKIEGRVTVQFFVQVDGSLSDFKIIKGIGYGCDEELIRLIKEGPKWKPSIQNNKATREKVRVRQKFSLPN